MATLLLLLKHTLFQFSAIFGIFIVGGLLLTLLAKWMNNAFRQFVWPELGLYLFGAVGIPIHEFSHALFAKLFWHEIKEIKWFDPAGAGGSNGAVTHQYNPWNLYQRIGHFFIGFGPAIFGSALMGALFYFLIPQGRGVLHASLPVVEFGFSGHEPAVFILKVLRAIFNRANGRSVGFYVFTYLALCISSQIELSTEDLKQGAKGIVPITLTLFIANVLAWALGGNWHSHVMSFGQNLTLSAAGVFAFAAILAAICLAICSLVLGLVNAICGKGGVNPFRN